MDFWIDGVCECGYKVIEGPSKVKDYVNFCSNESCEHHVLHDIFDMEELEYYKHEYPYSALRKENEKFNEIFDKLSL